MPTYQYSCTECGHAFETVQSFTDDALTECPACTGRLRKVYNAVGVVFKGSGFYRTDSREASGAKSGAASGASNGSGTPEKAGSGAASTASTGSTGSGSTGSGSTGSGSTGSGSTSTTSTAKSA